MGLLDLFNDPYQPSASSATAGLLSPQDKLMALFQGLSSAGAHMAQPGLGRGQALAMGLGGFGQGMAQGNQQAMVQKMMAGKLAEEQRKLAAQGVLDKAYSGGDPTPGPSVASMSGMPVAQAMAGRIGTAKEDALSKPEVQQALLSLYGPQGLAALQNAQKAPETVEGFDPQTGQPARFMFNRQTGRYDTVVGGSKVDPMQPVRGPDGNYSFLPGVVPALAGKEGAVEGAKAWAGVAPANAKEWGTVGPANAKAWGLVGPNTATEYLKPRVLSGDQTLFAGQPPPPMLNGKSPIGLMPWNMPPTVPPPPQAPAPAAGVQPPPLPPQLSGLPQVGGAQPLARGVPDQWVDVPAGAGGIPLQQKNSRTGEIRAIPGAADQQGSRDTATAAVQTADQLLKNIDDVVKHPSLNEDKNPIFGTPTGPASFLTLVPGTRAYDLGQRIDQLKGQAFLQAFNSLKGGGQITEVEGAKATQAIARLSSSQREADFRTALEDLRDVVLKGRARAEAQARGEHPQAGGPALPPGFRVVN